MNIPQLAENAAAAWLEAQTFTDIPAAQIYRGIEHEEISGNEQDTRKLPCIIVSAPRFSHEETLVGNWTGALTVRVRSNADDTTHQQHQTRTSQVWTALLTDTLAADLSSALTATGFTVHQALATEQGYDLVERSWQSFVTLQIKCAASEIS